MPIKNILFPAINAGADSANLDNIVVSAAPYIRAIP
jgi:hypothetical protein